MEREKDIHYRVAKLYAACGGRVYNLAQGYRPGGRRHATTRQTKGLPDLHVMFPARRVVFWHEVKRPKAKQTPEQEVFQAACQACAVGYVLGGEDEAIAHLKTIGLVSPSYNPR